MTGEAIALVITAAAAGIASVLTSVGGFVVLWKKLDIVEKATNGLAEKMGAAREEKGDAQGHERGLKEGRDEK